VDRCAVAAHVVAVDPIWVTRFVEVVRCAVVVEAATLALQDAHNADLAARSVVRGEVFRVEIPIWARTSVQFGAPTEAPIQVLIGVPSVVHV
jgi:hypothetical protein